MTTPNNTQDRRPCAAKDCLNWARSWSRYCHSHANRHRYTRSPTGRILRKRQDLGPYRELVAEYLPQWIKHPAMQAAIAYLDKLLVQESTYTGSSKTHRRIAKELRRLRLDGATGPAMLARVLTVEGYRYNTPGWDDGPCHSVNIGSQLIRTTPRPDGSKPKPEAIHALGQEVREALGVLPREFWQAVEREITKQARARDAISQALQDAPLA